MWVAGRGPRSHAVLGACLTQPPRCFPQNIHVCLGGLFVPEAYITATRQYVAQANSWSLEELCLEVNVTTSQGAALDACSFGVTGELRLKGRSAWALLWPLNLLEGPVTVCLWPA